MIHISLQKIVAFTSICVAAFSNSMPIMGLIGGENVGNSPDLEYAATISPFGVVTSLNLHPGQITSVALNKAGLGLMGGSINNNNYAAFFSSNNGLQEIPVLPGVANGGGLEVAINNSGLGLVGGREGPRGYATFVTQNSITRISLNLAPSGVINGVALNNANVGLIGGERNPFGGPAYAALVFPDGSAQPLQLNITQGRISSTAINDSGIGLIGGADTTGSDMAYVAYIMNGNVAPLNFSSSNSHGIRTVAINNSNIGLIGGQDHAALVYPNLTLQVLPGMPSDFTIESVSINDLGYGLIGGKDMVSDQMYAAFVLPNGTIQPLQGLPSDAGSLLSVDINEFNQGLVGGKNLDTDAPYLAIVSPSGIITPLNLGFSTGLINSVALNAFFLSQLPTQGLHGNNLLFANYINSYVPQNAFYFVPSALEGSLANALESAAPTRNALSFNVLLQNAFYFTTALSTHLRDQRYIHSRPALNASNRSTAQLEPNEQTENEEELLASRCFPKSKIKDKSCRTKAQKEHPKPAPLSVWLEAIGALAYFHSQHETPGFNPSTIGANLGFDGKVGQELTVGGGATYLYTHIHEKQDAGNAHINQEDLFLYASWEPKHFYLDLGLWGGLFQTHQNRNINMTGFSFQALSKPKGWQLVPHLELGWIGNIVATQKSEITWNLLGMLDWAHAWQRKYKEKGSSPFNTQQNAHHGSLLRTEAGLRFSETLFYQTWNLIFQEKGSYVNVQSFNAGKIKGFIVGSPGSFTLETLNNPQNLGVVQFLISAASFTKWHPTGTLFYQGEFGSKYQSHQLGLEFAMGF